MYVRWKANSRVQSLEIGVVTDINATKEEIPHSENEDNANHLRRNDVTFAELNDIFGESLMPYLTSATQNLAIRLWPLHNRRPLHMIENDPLQDVTKDSNRHVGKKICFTPFELLSTSVSITDYIL